jgi:hypothetical protein
MPFRPLAFFGPSFAAVLMLTVALRLAVARSLRSCGLCSGVLCRWPSKITVEVSSRLPWCSLARLTKWAQIVDLKFP